MWTRQTPELCTRQPVPACCFFCTLPKHRRQSDTVASHSPCHRFRSRILKLAVSGLSPLRCQTRRRETHAYTRRASFPCALDKARFFKPYPILASRLNDGCHFLGTLSAAASTPLLARKSCKRQLLLEACRFGRQTSFQAAGVGWSHRRRASVFFPVSSLPAGTRSVWTPRQ